MSVPVVLKFVKDVSVVIVLSPSGSDVVFSLRAYNICNCHIKIVVVEGFKY